MGINCHFALLQRRLGISPVNLFSFSYTPTVGLIKCLASRFEGLADGEGLSIAIVDGEYKIIAEKYGIWFHTYVFSSDADSDNILKRHKKIIIRLTEKIISDLESGEKYFVHKIADSSSMVHANSLVAAIQSYSPNNKALIVDQAASPEALGRLEFAGKNFFIGRIAVLEPPNGQWDINLPCWLSIITATHFAASAEESFEEISFFPSEEVQYEASLLTGGNIQIELAKVMALREGDKTGEALEKLQELKTQYPAEPLIYRSEVSLLTSIGCGADAVAAGKEALLRFPDDSDAADLLEKAFETAGLFDEAAAYWRSCVKAGFLKPKETLLRLTKALERQKRFDEAEEALRHSIGDPPDFDLLRSFAYLAEQSGRLADASERWQAIERYFPDFEGGYTGQGRVFGRTGDTDSAIVALNRGLERLPNSRQMLHTLAWIYEVRNDEAGLVATYDRFESLFPDDLTSFQRRTESYRRSKKWSDAAEMLGRGFAIHPKHSGLLEAAARLAVDQGQWEIALAHWTAYHMGGGPLATYCERASILRRMARFESAEAILREADRLHPDKSQYLSELAHTAVEKGDLELALERWHHFRQRFPGNPASITEIANLLAKLGHSTAEAR